MLVIRQHQKLDNIMAAGFEKYTPTQYCTVIGMLSLILLTLYNTIYNWESLNHICMNPIYIHYSIIFSFKSITKIEKPKKSTKLISVTLISTKHLRIEKYYTFITILLFWWIINKVSPSVQHCYFPYFFPPPHHKKRKKWRNDSFI